LPRHPDFEKIYRAFMKRYCGSEDNECERGRRIYYAWLKKLGLNDTKPYRKPQEAFRWAKSAFNLIKQDEGVKYYKVEALFPIKSMNHFIYTEDELIRAARTLIGKPVNLNHESYVLKGVRIVDAEYEDGAVEVLLRVLKTAGHGLGLNICNMIDNGEILHVSIEASCRNVSLEPIDGELGRKCEGLVFTGLALLTKDVLPGVPLTRIEPVEKIVESFKVTMEKEKMSEKEKEKEEENGEETSKEAEVKEREWDAAFINNLPDAAFAVIEPAYKRGDVEDKRCRHLPHHGPDVKDPNEHDSVDLPHLRNALARCNQIKPVTDSISAEELRRRAREHLLRHARALLPSYQDQEEAKEKKNDLLERLEVLERDVPQMLEIIPRVLLLEDRVKRLEDIIEELTGKEAAESVKETAEKSEDDIQITTEKTEEAPKILTREGFWERFRQLRNEGLSKSDAYRLTTIEVLEALARQKGK